MADWSGYLKRAVANVEQRLDQVLQETSEVGPGGKLASPGQNTRSPRASMEQGQQKAVNNGRASQETSLSLASTESDAKVIAESGPDAHAGTHPVLDPERAGAPQEDSPQPELVVVDLFEEFPTLEDVLAETRRFALSVPETASPQVKDACLDLTDHIAAASGLLASFEDNVRKRLDSSNSKIKLLSRQRADELADGTSSLAERDRQIALLLDEGSRLSQQELKLSMSLKKSKADRLALERKNATLMSQSEKDRDEIQSLRARLKNLESIADERARQEADEEMQTLRTQVEKLNSDLSIQKGRSGGELSALQKQFDLILASKKQADHTINELNALVEHFRSVSESHGKGADHSRSQDLKRRLESAQANHQAAADNWHGIEIKLLSQIADLESSIESCRAQLASSRERVSSLQQSLQDERAQYSELQTRHEQILAELETAKETSTREKTLAAEVHSKLAVLEPEHEKLRAQFLDVTRELETLKNNLPASVSEICKAGQRTSSVWNEISLDQLEPVPGDTTPVLEKFTDLEPFDSHEHEEILHNTDTPFSPGSLGSRAATDDTPRGSFDGNSFAAGDLSRESFAASGTEPSSHLLGTLNITIRKQANELARVKRALATADSEKQAAYHELMKYMDASEDLETMRIRDSENSDKIQKLESRSESLLEKLGEKAEQVSELQADVQDLKQMFQAQIETLVTELQTFKGGGD